MCHGLWELWSPRVLKWRDQDVEYAVGQGTKVLQLDGIPVKGPQTEDDR